MSEILAPLLCTPTRPLHLPLQQQEELSLYRKILRELIPRNGQLTVVDDVAVQPADIAEAYTAALGWTESQRRTYLANLTILSAIVPRVATTDDGLSVRSHAPEAVQPGSQYEPAEVSALQFPLQLLLAA